MLCSYINILYIYIQCRYIIYLHRYMIYTMFLIDIFIQIQYVETHVYMIFLFSIASCWSFRYKLSRSSMA